jgi:hypothetical protein
MADYDFKYELRQAPNARNDGSGLVRHIIWAYARDQTAAPADPWEIVPGRAKDINIPADELQAVADMPNSPQNAKVQAYKQALVDNLNTMPEPITGWGAADLEALMDANDRAEAAALAADDWITNTLGLSYPVPFTV